MGKTAYLSGDIFLQHDTGWGHPEKSERLSVINERINAAPYRKDLLMIQPSLKDKRYIESIHSKGYIQRVQKEIEDNNVQFLDSMDTAVCRQSYDVALQAVGGCLNVCDAILQGKASYGFCAVRPPGHHAEKDYAAGFCIFNNIAIAARYLQHKGDLNKIAIVDWDVHHGNGTQHSFEDDPSVFYISLHQYPHYPGTGSKFETGTGIGRGYTLNIPMKAGSNDADYLKAFEELIIPALNTFQPDIVLISAGFDAHTADPLSSIRLSTAAYGNFTRLLLEIARAWSRDRCIAFLEGGYHLQVLPDCVDEVMRVFTSF